MKSDYNERIVGITEDELESAVAWNKKAFLNLLSKSTNNPSFVSNPYRKSILQNPTVSFLLKQKTEKEGSTQGLLFVEKLRYTKDKDSRVMILEIPPLVIPELLKMVRG